MTETKTLTKDHYLDLEDGKFAGTTKADLDHLFETLAGDPDRGKLVIHFHGGNVSRAEGISNARRLFPFYRAAGAYPVFFVWNCGIRDVINDLRASLARPWRNRNKYLVSLRAIGAISKHRAHHILNMGFMLKRLITRFATGRSHGLRATITEEFMRVFFLTDLGDRVWHLIKRKTMDAFQPDETLYGGSAFLAGLRRCWENGYRPRIILVAHSGGSIYACHFLAHAAVYLPQAKFDVVFLAAAVTVEFFRETIEEYGDRIDNFRNFALTDELECADGLVPLIYPRSLLYFMSGVCEHDQRTHADLGDVPLVGMQRYVRDERTYNNPDILALRRFLAAQKRAVWSVRDEGPGLATITTKHIEFDQDNATIESIQHIIRHGF
jgi:hypothetical protein